MKKCKLEKNNDNSNLHKEAGIYTQRPSSNLTDENGIWIKDKHKIMEMWKQNLQDLFKDKRMDTTISEYVTGPPITEEETIKAIQVTKDGKAPGPDET